MAAQPADARPSCGAIMRDLAACYHVDIAAFCKDLCMGWEELARARRRSAGDHRCPYGQSHPMLAKLPDEGRALGNGDEPLGDRSRAWRAAGSIWLSGRRSDLGRAARVPDRGRAWLQDRGDDAAGRAVRRAPRAPDRAAAHLAQRRIPAAALRARAALRRGDRRCGTASAGSEAASGVAYQDRTLPDPSRLPTPDRSILACSSSGPAASPAAPSRCPAIT